MTEHLAKLQQHLCLRDNAYYYDHYHNDYIMTTNKDQILKYITSTQHTSFFLAPAVGGLRTGPADVVVWLNVDVGCVFS